MLPNDPERIQTVTTFDSWDRYQYGVTNDYYHQFTRNTFQLNNTDGSFSEIGRLLGVDASDWSWGALIFDMDNDGNKDLFIANGIYQDLTNQDFLQYISNEEVAKSISIPVIGIGAGQGVDGQVLVTHDMLGINKDFSPRFLRRYADLYDVMKSAFEQYKEDVKAGNFPNDKESY